MKRLILVSVFITVLFSSMALAGDISGQTFYMGDCSATFFESPFSGGEGGQAVFTCLGTPIDMTYIYDPPVLTVWVDDVAYGFILASDQLFYLDASGLTLEK